MNSVSSIVNLKLTTLIHQIYLVQNCNITNITIFTNFTDVNYIYFVLDASRK